MSFLDKSMSELTTAELQKLIADEVARQTPAIPTGVLALLDSQTPVTVPATQNNADVLTYDAAKGGYIAAPVPSSSPVTPPNANTPTVSSGIGYLAVTWAAVSNATPVDYDVYLSTVNGFTPGPSTFIGTTSATMIFIRADADGNPLAYTTATDTVAYYVAIIARSDNLSSASAQSAAAYVLQADSADIRVDAVHAEQINAGAVITGKLDTAVVLSGLIQTAEAGARIVIHGGADSGVGGITLYASDGVTKLVYLPTDGSSATFNGSVVTGALTVTDNAVIQGAANTMDRASKLTLTEKLGNPGATPVLTVGYDKVTSPWLLANANYAGSFGTNYTATGGSGGATPSWLVVESHFNPSSGKSGLTLRELDYTTGVQSRALVLESAEPFGAFSTPIGACKIGTKIYAFSWYRTGVLKIYTITASTFAIDATNTYGGTTSTLQGCSNSFTYQDHNVGLGSDGTNPYLFSYTTSTKLPNWRMVTITSPSAPTIGAATDFASGAVKFNAVGDANNPGTSAKPVGIAGAAYDGTNWYIAYPWESSSGTGEGTLLQMYKKSDGSIVTKQEIYFDDPDWPNTTGAGMAWDGTNFWFTELGDTLNNGGYLVQRKLTNLTYDYTLGTSIYLGSSWVKDTNFGTVNCGHDPVASVSYVGNRGSGTVDGTFALTWTLTTTGTSMVTGNRAILGIVLHSSDNTIDSVTGGGVTWVQDGYGHNTDGEVAYWFSAELPAGLASGTTLTVVEHTGGDVFEKRRWTMMEVAGITAGPPGGTHTHGSSGTSTTPSPGATSGSAASGDFAVSAIAFKNGSVTGDWTATSGWTKENTLSLNSRSGWFEYDILGSSGAVTGNVTTTLTAIQWAAAVVYYTQAGSGSSPLLVHAVAHGLAVDQEVYFTNSGGALPTGITVNTPYYVIATSMDADHFKVAASRGGSAVNTTGTDSGTTTLHTITETGVSPRVAYSTASGITAAPIQRQKVQFNNAGLPSVASAVRTYAQLASSAPLSTALRRQPLTTNVDSETAALVTLLGYSDTVNPPNPSNNFPGSAAASITASATAAGAPWYLGGDGVFRLPKFSVAQRLAGATIGDMAWNADANEVWAYNGRWWAPVDAPSSGVGNSYSYYNDFIATVNLADFSLYNNNGGVLPAGVVGEAKHPGLVTMATGTTANATGNTGMRLASAASSGASAEVQLGGGIVRTGVLVRFPVITTPFFHFRFGLVDSGMQGDPAVGFNFRYDPNVNSNKFQRAIAGTYTDTGATAVVAGTWYLLEMVVSADATAATFYINGVSAGVCSGAAQTASPVFLGVGIDKDTSSATSRTLDVDLIYLEGEFTANRYG